MTRPSSVLNLPAAPEALTPRARPRAAGWTAKYVRRAQWTDAALVLIAVAVAQQVRFGDSDTIVLAQGNTRVWIMVPCLTLAWLVSLRITQSADPRIIGEGATEYSRVFSACFVVFGALAIVDLAFNLGIARGFIAIALPLGTVGLLLSRRVQRHALARSRSRGHNLSQVLVIGEARSATQLIDHLDLNPALGYSIVGACLPPGPAATLLTTRRGRDVPVFGSFDEVRNAVALSNADTVAVTSAEALGHAAMRELSWELEGMSVEMLVAPGVTDVAGPRMTVRPVAGLPLLHIDKPRYEGANRLLKAGFDRIGALLLLIIFSPILFGCAAAIKLGNKGPIFYRAERIGANNEPFNMWKFRTMIVDADKVRESLTTQNEGAGLLFKMRSDPRVTRVGRILRRYSLDELPQLINVVNGTMSLVGPRPPLRQEVEQYDGHVRRRMLVRPGMTGLWQVSGRSELSWEEAVRLDLSYIENWSIMQDLMIMWRTARAVLGAHGAY